MISHCCCSYRLSDYQFKCLVWCQNKCDFSTTTQSWIRSVYWRLWFGQCDARSILPYYSQSLGIYLKSMMFYFSSDPRSEVDPSIFLLLINLIFLHVNCSYHTHPPFLRALFSIFVFLFIAFITIVYHIINQFIYTYPLTVSQNHKESESCPMLLH